MTPQAALDDILRYFCFIIWNYFLLPGRSGALFLSKQIIPFRGLTQFAFWLKMDLVLHFIPVSTFSMLTIILTPCIALTWNENAHSLPGSLVILFYLKVLGLCCHVANWNLFFCLLQILSEGGKKKSQISSSNFWCSLLSALQALNPEALLLAA